MERKWGHMGLTIAEIRDAAPESKPYKLADSGGPYLRMLTVGGKSSRYKDRFHGKEVRLKLGLWPPQS